MTRVIALAVALVLAPLGTPAMAHYVDTHLDVPYLRDCHGLFRHLDECAIPAGARGADTSAERDAPP